MPRPADDRREWLEADGLGGFASGTAAGWRSRRYHALLLVATTAPARRRVLVNGFEAWVDTPSGRYAISSQRYHPNVTHPDGAARISSFALDPWPHWTFRLEDGTQLSQEIFVPRGAPMVVLVWRLLSTATATLWVRPLLSGRDPHALHNENPHFRFPAEVSGERVVWHPYEPLPRIAALTTGIYAHDPLWYRNFLYDEERARGLDDAEDLASPGLFRFPLAGGPAVCIFSDASAAAEAAMPAPGASAAANAKECALLLSDREHRRRATFPSRLHRSADAYVVERGAGATIIAGYPWFGEWGRDTFVALRGLCLATGRYDEARSILLGWAESLSEGLLPNRRSDADDAPERNSVDASLWFVVAVGAFLAAADAHRTVIDASDRKRLETAVEEILDAYARGTLYGIRVDEDGLVAASAPGVQLTWMDAKVGDWVVTPRRGKPVEIQALWANALHVAGAFSTRWREPLSRCMAAFAARFWDEERGYLRDVVDVDGVAGVVDASLRPNQIFAAGGLPLCLLEDTDARRVVDVVESRLLTPLGLRSLAPGEPGYAGRYEGGPRERDGAYHQGTVWPWLIGPFVQAWVTARGDTLAARREARARFLAPLLRHLDDFGIGHIGEIADGDPPHTPRGCPFQAWSVAEALRLDRVVLAEIPAVDPTLRSATVNISPVQASNLRTRARGGEP
jgi:predicted glycogen debranching enzyme